jgi:hypothetical protein
MLVIEDSAIHHVFQPGLEMAVEVRQCKHLFTFSKYDIAMMLQDNAVHREGARLVDTFRDRAADRGRAQYASSAVRGYRAAGSEVASQDETVPSAEGDGVLRRWQVADGGLTVVSLGYPALVAQNGTRDDVRRLCRLRPTTAIRHVNDREDAPGVARR